MAELEADDGYQAARRAADAELAAREEHLSAAEQPLVDALSEVGVQVSSVWDLVNTTDDYAVAVPVLVEHLQDESYPDRVREGIARALSFRAAAPAWPAVLPLYRSTTHSDDLQTGLAVALAGMVTDETVDELVAEYRDEEHGEARSLLLLGLRRLRTRAAKQALAELGDGDGEALA